MLPPHQIEQPHEKLSPKALPLRCGVHRDSKFAKHMAEDPQLAPVRMQLGSETGQSLDLRDKQQTPGEALGNKAIDVVTGHFVG